MKRETPRGPQPGDVLLLGLNITLCHERHGSRAKVLNTAGVLKGVKIGELQGPYGLTISLSPTKSELTKQLVAFEAEVEKLQAEVTIADLWELLLEEKGEYTTKDLTEQWFGSHTPAGEVAIVRALKKSPAYFSKKNFHYTPKNPDKVEATLRDIESKQKKEQLTQEAVKWFSSLMVGRVSPPPPDSLSPYVQKLKQAAINGRHRDSNDSLTPILDALSLDGEHGPLTILVQMGIFSEDENLLLHRHRVPRQFTDEQIKAAEELAAKEGEEDDGNREVVEVPAIAVDDADTRERDDALTIEKLADGWSVGIHITDVASWLERDSVVDQEAQRRAVTVYTPSEVITMLPTAISHSLLSLNPGKKRRAISVFAKVDNEFNVQETRLARTLITMKEALTYEELLQRTKEDENLSFLCKFADNLRNKRGEAGARIDATGDELKVRCNGDEIMVKKLNRACPARLMVSELMILANKTVASLLAEKNIPCIFRTQEKVELDEDSIINRLPSAAMPKVQVSTTPKPHATLGVACYTQSTSPLRRYGDLLIQRQLSALLSTNGAAYSEQELNYLIDATEMANSTSRAIEKWANRYWLLKYLAQRVGQTTQATVVERRKDCCIVLLSDYLMNLRFFPSPSTTYVKGDIIDVRLVDVHPRRNQIRVEEAH